MFDAEWREREVEKPLNAGAAPAYFSAHDIHAYYGESYIVQGVSFAVHEGEILALLGRNGAGKTTTLRAIARVDSPELKHGEIRLDHQPLHSMRAFQAARHGVALVPEDRRIIVGPDGRGEPPPRPDRPTGRLDDRAHLRALPPPGRAPRPGGRHPLGRRAADAGDRPGLGARRQAPPP